MRTPHLHKLLTLGILGMAVILGGAFYFARRESPSNVFANRQDDVAPMETTDIVAVVGNLNADTSAPTVTSIDANEPSEQSARDPVVDYSSMESVWAAEYQAFGKLELRDRLAELEHELDAQTEISFQAAYDTGRYKSAMTPGGREDHLEPTQEKGIHRARYEWTPEGWLRKTASLTPQSDPALFALFAEVQWLQRKLSSQ